MRDIGLVEINARTAGEVRLQFVTGFPLRDQMYWHAVILAHPNPAEEIDKVFGRDGTLYNNPSFFGRDLLS